MTTTGATGSGSATLTADQALERHRRSVANDYIDAYIRFEPHRLSAEQKQTVLSGLNNVFTMDENTLKVYDYGLVQLKAEQSSKAYHERTNLEPPNSPLAGALSWAVNRAGGDLNGNGTRFDKADMAYVESQLTDYRTRGAGGRTYTLKDTRGGFLLFNDAQGRPSIIVSGMTVNDVKTRSGARAKQWSWVLDHYTKPHQEGGKDVGARVVYSDANARVPGATGDIGISFTSTKQIPGSVYVTDPAYAMQGQFRYPGYITNIENGSAGPKTSYGDKQRPEFDFTLTDMVSGNPTLSHVSSHQYSGGVYTTHAEENGWISTPRSRSRRGEIDATAPSIKQANENIDQAYNQYQTAVAAMKEQLSKSIMPDANKGEVQQSIQLWAKGVMATVGNISNMMVSYQKTFLANYKYLSQADAITKLSQYTKVLYDVDATGKPNPGSLDGALSDAFDRMFRVMETSGRLNKSENAKLAWQSIMGVTTAVTGNLVFVAEFLEGIFTVLPQARSTPNLSRLGRIMPYVSTGGAGVAFPGDAIDQGYGITQIKKAQARLNADNSVSQGLVDGTVTEPSFVTNFKALLQQGPTTASRIYKAMVHFQADIALSTGNFSDYTLFAGAARRKESLVPDRKWDAGTWKVLSGSKDGMLNMLKSMYYGDPNAAWNLTNSFAPGAKRVYVDIPPERRQEFGGACTIVIYPDNDPYGWPEPDSRTASKMHHLYVALVKPWMMGAMA